LTTEILVLFIHILHESEHISVNQDINGLVTNFAKGTESAKIALSETMLVYDKI
jgi:hypothetical protein